MCAKGSNEIFKDFLRCLGYTAMLSLTEAEIDDYQL